MGTIISLFIIVVLFPVQLASLTLILLLVKNVSISLGKTVSF